MSKKQASSPWRSELDLEIAHRARPPTPRPGTLPESPERCAKFGSPHDIKEYLDATIYPIGDKRFSDNHRNLVGMSEEIVKRALSDSSPKLRALSAKEARQLEKHWQEIARRWKTALPKNLKPETRGKFGKWSASAKCAFLQSTFDEMPKSPETAR